MVNWTQVLMMPRHAKNTANDGYWRKRQIFKLSAHFTGRARNCFSIAIRRVQRSLQYVSLGRKLRKTWHRELWHKRITAGCEELGNIPQGHRVMLEGLARSEILLNRQSLANLAVWEPRTFKALNDIAAEKGRTDKVHPDMGPPPNSVKGKLP